MLDQISNVSKTGSKSLQFNICSCKLVMLYVTLISRATRLENLRGKGSMRKCVIMREELLYNGDLNWRPQSYQYYPSTDSTTSHLALQLFTTHKYTQRYLNLRIAFFSLFFFFLIRDLIDICKKNSISFFLFFYLFRLLLNLVNYSIYHVRIPLAQQFVLPLIGFQRLP